MAIFVVGLLAISAASAADNATDNIISAENTAYDTISAQDSQTILKESQSVGNFTELSEEIRKTNAGDTLNLSKDYKYVDGSSDGIRIDKDIIIDGQGRTIDGNHQSRIFYVTASNVTFKNITFINGYTTGSGGAIYWQGSGSLYNCNFINNTANESGGANHFTKELTNTTITGNYNHNTAQHNGGANHFVRTLNHVNITGNYNNNTANESGGANYFLQTLTNVQITGNYNHNTALNQSESIEGGGANYFKEALENVTITGNYTNNIAYAYGGANCFYNTLTQVTITGNYTNNTAQREGGANNFLQTLTNVQITGNYTNNTAQREGGANEFEDNLTNVQITGNYTNNIAYAYGGANAFDGELTNVQITGNYNNNIAQDAGANRFSFTLTNVNITGNYNNNTAQTGYGGANNFQYTLTNTTITGNYNNNTANQTGGANYFYKSLENVNITGNYTNNSVPIQGGANFFLGNLTRVKLRGSYTDNRAEVGGANNFNGTLTHVTINGNYTNNKAQNQGGANNFNEELNNVNITGNYTNNRALGPRYENGGGANYFTSALTNTTINGNYNHNTAKEYGGANRFEGTLNQVTINGNYTNNTSNGGGANLFMQTLNQVTINGNYNHNTVQSLGGANYFYKILTNVNITGNYNHNTANEYGGANYFYDKLTNTTITGNYNNNTAQIYGGANRFYVLTNVTINGNYINNTGINVIYIYNSKSGNLIHDSIFLNQNNTITIENGNIKAKDTWFGSNATNYNERPDVGDNVDMENWLFLNATADPSSLLVSDSSKILFKLYSYNSTGTFDYDNAKLSAVNLTLTATNGNVNSTAQFEENITYTAASRGTGSVTASVENAAYTIKLNIKGIPELSLGNQEIYYSNNAVIAINYTSTATGKVNITLKGKKSNYELTDITLNATVSLGKLNLDKYNITITYSGDDSFSNASATGNLTVLPIVDLSVNITADKDNYYYHDIVVWTITVKNAENATNATNINMTDFFPTDKLEFINCTLPKGTSYNNKTHVWTIGNMANGTELSLVINTRAIVIDDITNAVHVDSKETDWNEFNNDDDYTVNILPLIDVSVNITSDKEDYFIDDIATWTIIVHNAANGTNATNVNLTEVFPDAFFDIISCTTENGTYYSNNGTWYIGFIGNGTDAVLVITARAKNLGKDIPNSVSVLASETDRNPDNQYDENLVDIINLPDIVLTVGNKDHYYYHDEIDYNITITSEGTANYTNNLTVSASLPKGLEFVRLVNVSGTDVVKFNQSTLTWVLTNIAPEAVITLRARISEVDNLTSNATLTSPNGTEKKAVCTIESEPYVDISVVKTSDKDTYYLGDIAIWTITVHNAANNTNATGVYLVENFPEEYFEIINITTKNGTVKKNIGNQYIWTIGFMANGTDAILIITSRAVQPRLEIYNFVYTFPDEDEWDGENNFANKSADIIDIPQISKTASNESPYFNDEIIYNLTITHTGNGDYKANLTLVDCLGEGLEFLAVENIIGTDIISFDETTLTWILTNITNETPAVITIKAKAIKTGNLTNNLSLINSNGYKRTVNCTVDVQPIVDLSVNITPDRKSYFIGDEAVWTITVYNAGNGTAALEIIVEEFFPSQYFEYIGYETDNGVFDNESMEWNISFMQNSTSATLYIHGHAKVSKTHITNRVIVVCNERDWNISNNLAYSYVDVEKLNSTIDLNDTVLDYGNTTSVRVTATGSTGITAKINGTNATVDGFTIEIPLMDAGTYSLTVTTIPDENHTATNKTMTITVNKVDSTLTLNNIVFDYNASGSSEVSFNGALGINAEIMGHDEAVINVSGNTITLSNLNAGNYTLTVTTIADANHNNVTRSVNVTVNKIDSTLTVGNIAFDYNSTGSATLSFTGATAVNASVINQPDAVANVKNGEITVSNLNAGDYTLTVTTIPDDNHLAVTKTANITVNKIDSTLTVDNIAFDYNSTGSATLSFTGATAVNASVINQPDAVVNVKNGEITVSNLNAGDYTLTVTTIPDDNHLAVTKTANITVSKIDSALTVDSVILHHGETANVSVTTEGAVGITAKIGDEDVTVNENTIAIPLLDAGNYTLTVTTVPDDNHNAVTKTANITVIPVADLAVTKTASAIEAEVGDDFTYTITVTNNGPSKATNVIISDNLPDSLELQSATLDGEKIDFTGEYVIASIDAASSKVIILTVKATKSGLIENTVKVTAIEEDQNPENNQANVSININKIMPSLEVTIPEKATTLDSIDINIKMPADADKVTVKLDDVEIAVANFENGQANIKPDSLAAGTHTISVVYDGSDKYLPTTEMKDITVSKVLTHILIEDATRNATDYNAGERGGNLTALLLDENNNTLANMPVEFKINGVTYKLITDDAGAFSLQINLKSAKTYTNVLSFKGDDTYNATSITSKLTIVKKKTSIKASNKSFKAKSETKTIKVTLKTIKNAYNGKTYIKKGKKLTLIVKGKTYHAKINNKGVAKFIIKLSRKGKFTAKIKFAGDRVYKASNKKIKITIK